MPIGLRTSLSKVEYSSSKIPHCFKYVTVPTLFKILFHTSLSTNAIEHIVVYLELAIFLTPHQTARLMNFWKATAFCSREIPALRTRRARLG